MGDEQPSGAAVLRVERLAVVADGDFLLGLAQVGRLDRELAGAVGERHPDAVSLIACHDAHAAQRRRERPLRVELVVLPGQLDLERLAGAEEDGGASGRVRLESSTRART